MWSLGSMPRWITDDSKYLQDQDSVRETRTGASSGGWRLGDDASAARGAGQPLRALPVRRQRGSSAAGPMHPPYQPSSRGAQHHVAGAVDLHLLPHGLEAPLRAGRQAWAETRERRQSMRALRPAASLSSRQQQEAGCSNAGGTPAFLALPLALTLGISVTGSVAFTIAQLRQAGVSVWSVQSGKLAPMAGWRVHPAAPPPRPAAAAAQRASERTTLGFLR